MKTNSFDLSGKRVAVLAADGFEQSELLVPVEALQTAGAKVDVVSPDGESIRGWKEKNWGQVISADASLSEANPADYDGLLLPGGVINSDALRTEKKAQEFVRHFMSEAKPTFAICHGAQVMIDADVIKGREMTSVEAIAADLKNAGARWRDEEVVVDNGFVTSRTPDDLPAFCAKVCEELAEGVHA